MDTTQFTIYPIDTTIPQLCRIDIKGEVYNITIEGKRIGWMERDFSVNFGFTTLNPEVQPLIEELTGKLLQIQLRKDFAVILNELWGTNMISTQFINDETLLAIVYEDIDLVEFGNVVNDLVHDYVEFDSPLNLILKNDKTGAIFEVGIN